VLTKHRCPVWVGYLLLVPWRRLWHPPEGILRAYVNSGDRVLDLGCALGYFSLPLARLVGPAGRVVCVDVQEVMLRKLRRRAARAGLAERIETRTSAELDLGLDDLDRQVAFVLAFAVLHETHDEAGALAQVARVLAPGGRLLVAEPRGHVPAATFSRTLAHASRAGLSVCERPAVPLCHAALLSPALPAAVPDSQATPDQPLNQTSRGGAA
jgi:ubiquinone/menaquinone biosynthesis C-methylase UbiE